MYDCEQLRERLSDLGFEVEENEEERLKGALKRAEQTVMNNCNCECVPPGLRFAALDIAAGEYLLAAGCAEGDERVKSVSEGDVSVTFSDKTAVESIVDSLLTGARDEMLNFRRLKW